MDDVIQETYLTGFTKINQLKNIEHINLWLYKILKNKCLAVLRKKDRISTVNQKSNFYKNALTDVSLEKKIENQPYKEDLYAAIHSLSEKLKVVVLLRYFSMCETYHQARNEGNRMRYCINLVD